MCPHPPARAASYAALQPYTIDPVPAMITMPGASPLPATSAIRASLTTSVRERWPRRRMMARTVRASSSRSTPAMPTQIAAGVIERSPMAVSITSWSTFSRASSPAVWRFAPGPRPSDWMTPFSSASRHTVFVPPASMPSTSMASEFYLSSNLGVGFSGVDYAVLAAYLVGITWFGSRFRRTQTTVKDYFLGNRQTSWIVISLSIVATETSTLTLIGVPALAFSTFRRPEQGG